MYALALALALAADPQPQRLTWTIDGVTREALVVAPTKAGPDPAPVVFAYHGHGGTMRHAARRFALHTHWPEAVVVYMQGLPTPGRTDPDGKRSGWQHFIGDQKDRDLKFFDAVLATIKQKYTTDPRRVYATGHSNGGVFTYLMWAARPAVFAAYAPSASPAGRNLVVLTPAPVLHLAGEKDMVVSFTAQQRTMAAVRKLNGCDEAGTAWAKGCTQYPSKGSTPVVTFIHPGDHKYPDEAPALIVKFFREHARP